MFFISGSGTSKRQTVQLPDLFRVNRKVNSLGQDIFPKREERLVAINRHVKYCVITSVRNEERFITGVIESVLNQTIRPSEWIIVDDGSSDSTAAVVARYAQEHPWIRFTRREDRGYRSTGGGVEGFLSALPLLRVQGWEFLVNLDGDVTFGPDYFERCFEQFRDLPALGIGGGTVYTKFGEHWQVEKAPSFHVRGATKIYRRECWEVLGGLWRSLGWDTVEEIKANQVGWKTQTFPGIRLFHHRVSGKMWGGWGFAIIDGEADYVVGYHPLFFGLKCIRHIFYPPLVIRSVGMAYGYLRGIIRRTPRATEGQLRKYLRRQQIRRIFGIATIWK